MKTKDTLLLSVSDKDVQAFGGVSILLVTPLDHRGRLCEEDLVSLLKFVGTPRVEGVSIGGVTVCGEMGEGFCLSLEERSQVIRLAKQTLGKDKSVIAALFALSLREALEQAESARRSGADALLVAPVAPFLYSEKVLQRFFQSIGDTVQLPMIAYLNKMFKQDLPPVTVIEAVYEISGVIGIKDSTGSSDFMNLLIERRPAGKLMIQTVSRLALEGVLAGADGLTVGTSNLIPESVLEVWVFGRKKDSESQLKAKAAQERLNQAALFYQVATAQEGDSKDWVVVKEALAQMGIIREEAKYPSPPYEVLSLEHQKKISHSLSELVGRSRERVLRP